MSASLACSSSLSESILAETSPLGEHPGEVPNGVRALARNATSFLWGQMGLMAIVPRLSHWALC